MVNNLINNTFLELILPYIKEKYRDSFPCAFILVDIKAGLRSNSELLEVNLRFLFQTKPKYLHPYRQTRIAAKRKVLGDYTYPVFRLNK